VVHICYTPESANSFSNRSTVINVLAVAGFIAIIGGSMWLAVYSTRYVPNVVGRMGAAAVYLGAVFTPAPEPTLSVIPTASTTLPFGEEVSSSISTTTVPTEILTAPSKPVTTTAGKQTTKTIQIGGATTTPKATVALSGLPDFAVTIHSVGYLASTTADSFIATTTISGTRPAVSFTIKNIGTNVTGPWRWSISIPTQMAYLYESTPQQSLAPGDSIDYTLGFDQATVGTQTVSVTANFDKTVTESNDRNNTTSAIMTITY